MVIYCFPLQSLVLRRYVDYPFTEEALMVGKRLGLMPVAIGRSIFEKGTQAVWLSCFFECLESSCVEFVTAWTSSSVIYGRYLRTIPSTYNYCLIYTSWKYINVRVRVSQD